MIDKNIVCGRVDAYLLQIDSREISARLGYETDLDTVKPYLNAVLNSSDCRFAYIKVPLQICESECDFDFAKLNSVSLSRVLRDCNYAYILAVTLGIDVDRLISKSYITNKSDAIVIDAIASAIAEALADYVNAIICKDLTTTKRFSPGYADFPLEFQKCLSEKLNLLNSIGISLTDSLMMIPRKSITAVIGIKNT